MTFSGFQNSMAQNNAYQIVNGINEIPTSILLGGTPAGPNINPNAANFFYDMPYEVYKREQAVIAEREDAIIALKIEAQANLLRQRELRAAKDKQTARQLKALENQQRELELDIKTAMIELDRRRLIANNNNAILILLMSYPYLNITQGGTMH